MRFPQLIVCGADEWAANQLRPLAAERRWLVRAEKKPVAAFELVRDSRPTVLFVQADPSAEDPDALRLVADVHRTRPDVAVVVLSESKLNDAAQSAWAAAAFDLGAQAVLFPPLTRPVLEDLATGLMAATVRRLLGDRPIDLADEGYEHD